METLLCPKCGTHIEVATALAAQLRKDIEGDIAKREANLEHEVARRLSTEKTQLQQHADAKAKETLAVEFGDLQTQLAETKTKLGEAQKAELQLRKDRRTLEAEKKEMELAVNRKLDEERSAIRTSAKSEALEEGRLREADRDKHIGDLKRQIDELKRKSEQGSSQAHGEVLELMLEDSLRQQFSLDTIEDVPVGVHGGDLIQRVFDSAAQDCGILLWESKRTKAWSDTWLPKLRDDQRAAKAHLAILVTAELPRGITAFGCIDGVWITKRQYALSLAGALRSGLLEIARTRRSLDGRQTKSELLLQYVAGPEFRQHVEGIAETFVAMQSDLDVEKRATQRLWAKRAKQLDRVIINTSSLHGDLSAILGGKLPQIDLLELAEIPSICHADELVKAPWE
jgi:hypothetical protein